MGTIRLPADFRDFLKLLNSHHVDYLLIGGYAVCFYGFYRTTVDIDFWVAVSPVNARKPIGCYKEAVKCLDRIVDAPDRHRWRIKMSRAMLLSKPVAAPAAEEFFKEALKLNPADTIPYVFYAEFMAQRERFVEAEALLRSVSEVLGDPDEVVYLRGRYKATLREYDEAKALLLRAVALASEPYAEAEEVLQDLRFLETALITCNLGHRSTSSPQR